MTQIFEPGGLRGRMPITMSGGGSHAMQPAVGIWILIMAIFLPFVPGCGMFLTETQKIKE